MSALLQNLPSHANGVREGMGRLPGFLQPTLTWVTGKALPGQRPLFEGNAFTQAAAPLTGLLGGAFLAWNAVAAGGLALLTLFPIWLVMVGSARKLQVTIAHQCAHFAFTGDRAFDWFLGQALTTLLLVDHMDSYYHEHVEIHHTRQLSTAVDPDCKFLLELGIRPGMSEKSLWNRLLLMTISPCFHAKFLNARLRANFVSAPQARRISAGLFHGSVLAVVAASGSFVPFFFAWVVPVYSIYHIAALLNFSSLHFWLKQPSSENTPKQTICTLTAGRFLGEPVPTEGSGVAAWVKWSARMCFVHLPARVAVLSGDLPVHDYHHRHARCPRWADYLYTRQWDIDTGCQGWPTGYTEHWGLKSAITAVLATMANAPRDLLDREVFPEGAAERAMVQS